MCRHGTVAVVLLRGDQLSLSEIEVQFRIACVLCLCGKWTVMEDSVSLFS